MLLQETQQSKKLEMHDMRPKFLILNIKIDNLNKLVFCQLFQCITDCEIKQVLKGKYFHFFLDKETEEIKSLLGK
jgi:hypothetical protein